MSTQTGNSDFPLFASHPVHGQCFIDKISQNFSFLATSLLVMEKFRKKVADKLVVKYQFRWL